MTNRDALESMLDTIARLDVKDETSIRAAFSDPKPVAVSIGKRGLGLTLGKSVSILTYANGEINSGAGLTLASIAPIDWTFMLGKAAESPPIETVVAPVVVVEGDLPRRKTRESGKGQPGVA